MICRDESIILKTRDFRETSKIVVFYTRKFGKMNGLLKGIRKDSRKFASNLSFLSINEVIFYKKRLSDLHLVSHCDLKKDFNCLRTDLVKFGLATFAAEFIDHIMPPEENHPEIFELLTKFLQSLETTTTSPNKLIYNFSLKALALSGFQPHLDNCLICKKMIGDRGFFSHRLGGLLCIRCAAQDTLSQNILGGTIASILFLQSTPWEDSLRLNILPSIEKQMRQIIFSFLDFHLDKRFKSLKIVNEVLDHKEKIC